MQKGIWKGEFKLRKKGGEIQTTLKMFRILFLLMVSRMETLFTHDASTQFTHGDQDDETNSFDEKDT